MTNQIEDLINNKSKTTEHSFTFEMLINTVSTAVIDIEGFRYKNSTFIIKELAVISDSYSDHITFGPPKDFHELTLSQQKAYSWVTNFLHGLSWYSGCHSYKFLQQILLSITLRLPNTKFFAKGKEKCAILSELLQRKVTNLEDLNCPSIEKILDIRIKPCSFHSSKAPPYQVHNHCASRKAKLFHNWLITKYDQSEYTDSISSDENH